jgi:S-adenosylmethionine hydrolase
MITLTTDFSDSEYVGAMKGVLYSINPNVLIVDLTHSIRPFDIRHGAYAIYSTAPFFPKGTIHVVVVDPGVGTERKGIIIESQGQYYVGPDNGVFSLIDGERIYEILKTGRSSTFHGRDVFSPVAAGLDKGKEPQDFGREIKGYSKVMKRDVVVGEKILGEVFCTDAFGNIITSIKEEHLSDYGVKGADFVNIKVGEKSLRVSLSKTYGTVDKGQVTGVLNSFDHFEITVREGSAAERLGVKGGEALEVFT